LGDRPRRDRRDLRGALTNHHLPPAPLEAPAEATSIEAMLARILVAIAAAATAFALAFSAAEGGSATPAPAATPTPIELDDVAIAVPRFESGLPLPELAPERRRSHRRAAPAERQHEPRATTTPHAVAPGPASPTGRPDRPAQRRASSSPGAPVTIEPAPAPTTSPAPPPVQDPVEDEAPAGEEPAE
jgi:hypothetical protein